MIPKKIHYCWFGGNPMSELGEKCIASWKKYCPDYEIIRWDESNYDVTKNEYMRQAYDAKKWAFVSDYARLDIIYQYGGVYLDTDVELIKSIDELCLSRAFMGIGCTGGVNTGLGFGAETKMTIIKELRDYYDNVLFVNEDGTYNTAPCVKHQTEYLLERGFVDEDILQNIGGITIYPREYLCPMDYSSGALSVTDNTYSIHHYESSHWSKRARNGNLRMRRAQENYGKVGFYLYSHSRMVRLLDMVLKGELQDYINEVRKGKNG